MLSTTFLNCHQLNCKCILQCFDLFFCIKHSLLTATLRLFDLVLHALTLSVLHWSACDEIKSNCGEKHSVSEEISTLSQKIRDVIFTLFLYQASASFRLHAEISLYWLFTSARIFSMFSCLLLSICTTTDVFFTSACSSRSSYREREPAGLGPAEDPQELGDLC